MENETKLRGELVIEPGRASLHYWRDLYRYRELFYFLAWRDLLVRYKQTVIGVAWAVLRPLLTMAVFVIVFGRIAKLPDGGIPYPILVFSAMLPWQFFANALSESSSSLVGNANLVSKIYFPRMILPASSVIVALVDFAISFVLLLIIVAVYQFPLSWHMLALPGFVLLAFFAALGPGLLITALNVKYRDFRYVVPFVVQMGLYISPVGFRSDVVPEEWRLLYSLNPMVGVIDGFRWCVAGPEAAALYVPGFVLSMGVVVGFLWLGVWYFRKTERQFADVI
jgi:lipopolysaccharide transport system permease protein